MSRGDSSDILSPEAAQFVSGLVRTHRSALEALLSARRRRQAELDRGARPAFLAETRGVRDGEWQVRPAPRDLEQRKVEITGPAERKMIINALNSGADVFMADFEDSLSPTWENVLAGQRNLRDAVRREITFESPDGKRYALKENLATLVIRPRGLHLLEKHFLVDDLPAPAPLFDFGLYLFHNAAALRERGTGPYFYLVKLESHREARWWEGVLSDAENRLGLPHGTIRVTVLIETILAAFEMDEILFELRDHITGLNAGRWDYIFSFIKKFRQDPSAVLPDRAQLTMDGGFLAPYAELLVRTCHRRGAHAIGGMSAYIPVRNNPEANERALAAVRADKEREARLGYDGTWVAHPGLVPLAQEVFGRAVPGPNQLAARMEGVAIGAEALLQVPQGEITEDGIRTNLSVTVEYLERWMSGEGCVPLRNIMEDAATAEISRAQLWQWLYHRSALVTGKQVTPELLARLMHDEMELLRHRLGESAFLGRKFPMVESFVMDLVTRTNFEEFMTLTAYRCL